MQREGSLGGRETLHGTAIAPSVSYFLFILYSFYFYYNPSVTLAGDTSLYSKEAFGGRGIGFFWAPSGRELSRSD